MPPLSAPLTPTPSPPCCTTPPSLPPRANKYDLHKVPGPWKKAYPVIGNCLSLLKPDFHRQFLAWNDEYGGICRIKFFWQDVLLVTDPEALGSIMGRGEHSIDKAFQTYAPINKVRLFWGGRGGGAAAVRGEGLGGAERIWLVGLCGPAAAGFCWVLPCTRLTPTPLPRASLLSTQMTDPHGNPNLLTAPADDKWKAIRKGVAVSFAFQNIKKKFPMILQRVNVVTNRAAALGPKASIDVDQLALRVTLDVIGLAGFGHDYQSVEKDVPEYDHLLVSWLLLTSVCVRGDEASWCSCVDCALVGPAKTVDGCAHYPTARAAPLLHRGDAPRDQPDPPHLPQLVQDRPQG